MKNLIKNTRPTRLATLLAILLSAACYFLGAGFNEIWPLAWVAPLPILWLGLSETRQRVILISAFLAYFLGGLNVLFYLKTLLPLAVFIPGQIISAIFFAIIIFVSCQMIKRTRTWYSVFIFPAAWVTYEFLAAHFSSAGTLDSVAYSQSSVLPIIQMVSITGIWGVSFLLALFPSAVAVAWFLHCESRKNRARFQAHKFLDLSCILSLCIPLSIFLLVLAFGYLRLANDSKNKTIKIGLLAVPETISDLLSREPSKATEIAKRFIQEIPKLKNQHADIVVMPEKIIATTAANEKRILSFFQKAARDNKISLVLGVNQIKSDGKYNTALFIDENGHIRAEFHKEHMLPGLESGYVRGKKVAIIPLKQGLAGLTICKDMDFISPGRNYSQKGVGIMFVPALDFVIDDWLHAKPAILRGVEGGYSVVRSAQWGLLSVTDAYGRVLAYKKTSLKNPTILVADVPMGEGKAFYAQCGNGFAWLCVILFLILFVFVFAFRGKRLL